MSKNYLIKRTIKICVCGKEISIIPSRLSRTKYCSRKCQDDNRTRKKGLKYIIHKENPTSFKKGITPWNKGKPSASMKDNPSCPAIHDWIKRWGKDLKKCELCGVEGKRLDWSSKSAKRIRDLSDWQRICRKCHCRYDFENFGARKKFYTKKADKCQIV